MENLQTGEGSGASDVAGESSDSTFQINIKTLDSRIFSFNVDNNILVSDFKEKIASQVSVPVGQQRLIFRGKVLKDEHLLSEYNLEHGDTLHLVERQPQPPPGPNTQETTSGHDSTSGGPHSRIGQIAHSVVLGTLNVRDQGDAVVPDLSQVIGAVLNSIALGNLAGGMQPGVQAPHGNEAERSQDNAGSQVQGGHLPGPFQTLHGQSAFNPMQNPVGTATAVPSLNMPIPDSLNTLTEFMNQMESALSQNGTQPVQSPTASGSPPTPELPVNSQGFPTVEALTTVLRHAQRLLSGRVVPALGQTAGRLDQEGESSDPAIRGQVQTESVQLGVAMQHLGALLLELGRTILTLRIGQSSGGSFLNAGPAVYISSSGPNPIMVQPFPLQTSSLFGGSGVTPIHIPMGPFGSITRNVNIHIHTHTGASLASIGPMVGSRAPNGEEIQGELVNGAPGEFGQAQAPSRVNVPPTAVPLRPAVITVSGAALSQASDPSSVSSIAADIYAEHRNVTAQGQSENQAPSGGAANQEPPGVRDIDTSSHPRNLSSSIADEVTQTSAMDRSSLSGHAEGLDGPSGSSQGNNIQAGSSGVPLGLGLGGLQPKRRAKNNDGASSSRAVGQQVLQSLVSLSTKGDANLPSSGQPLDLARGVSRDMSTTRQNTNDNIDVADAMSQALGSSSLDGLLAGVSRQTGVGSPDMLRNMLQQFTQNPAMRNTMNQMAQQMEGQDLGSMFSGGGQGGGGFDLSRMMQQMIPIVSQALGGISSGSQLDPPQEQVFLGNSTRRDMSPTNDDRQIDFQQVVRRLGEESSPEEILYNMVNGAARLSNSGGRAEESLVNAILSNESGLAQEFMDMLLLDLSRRLEDGV